MRRIWAAVFTVFFLCLSHWLIGQPFRCDGRLILSTISTTTSSYNVEFNIGGAVYGQITAYANEQIDGLGFNPKDNYIYGVHQASKSIARLRANGTFELLGTVPEIPEINAFAGDCTPEGLYMCYDNELHQILVFEVRNNLRLLDRIDLFWNPNSQNSGPFTTRIEDFAINPNNPTEAYSFQGRYFQDEYEPALTKGYLLRINLDLNDPNAGMVTPIRAISGNTILQLGSLFFNAGGALYGFGPYTAGPFFMNRLIAINPFTAEVTNVWTGLAGAASDGCSCPYGLSFTNDIQPRNVTCSDSEVTFTFTIHNRSNENMTTLTLTDTLPDGMRITRVSDDFRGTVAAGTGVGRNIITINNLQVGPKARVVIDVTAAIDDITTGFLTNQAHLRNLPTIFDGYRRSDDPVTNFIGDRTQFSSDPLPIDSVALDIRPPTDCFNPYNGQVTISSPQFLPNQQYDIQLVNQNWEPFDYSLTIDRDRSFTLDSMGPGSYQLLEVLPQNSACSFEWKNEKIEIEPPNNTARVGAGSNSPVCEGSSLEFNSVAYPMDVTVRWTGPESFGSTDFNPSIDSATADQSGTYKVTATYGICEQVKEIEVEILEALTASISGDLEYCEREQLQLTVESGGSPQAFRWSGPDNMRGTDQTISVEDMSPDQAGVYQVILDNGVCQDTDQVEVFVLPSPTIILPAEVKTDFCESTVLTPEISGDDQVTYAWTPSNGLSCADCPSPELAIPFMPNYQLTVLNEFNCADSASVNTVLDTEKLLFAPNVFSPNFDGTNDYFQLFPGCGVARIKSLYIVNRWGAIVFTNDEVDHQNQEDFWDGMVAGEMGVTGVYVWQAEVELVDGSTRKLYGDVSLVK